LNLLIREEARKKKYVSWGGGTIYTFNTQSETAPRQDVSLRVCQSISSKVETFIETSFVFLAINVTNP